MKEIINTLVTLVLALINALGAIAWMYLYVYGIHVEWWVIALIALCGTASSMFFVKFYKQIIKK
jgi:hypothetical protein